ncbi:MAG: hypothetical protein J6Y01_08840 [Spirochaetales bacterium]|nr:hypothetical protein [Spirochaetales bacterium]
MKKIFLVIAVLGIVTAMVSAGERYSQQTNVISQNGSIHFSLPSDKSSVRLLSDDESEISTSESIGPSHSSSPKKKSGKEIAGLVVGGIGAGMFGLTWFSYFIPALVAPIVGCAQFGETIIENPLNIGVVATSWIPIIGPFAGGGFNIAMSVHPDYYYTGCESVYAGTIAASFLAGFAEIMFFSLMVAGFAFAGYQRNKSKMAMALLNGKVMPIVGTVITQDKTANEFGVRIRI